MGKINVNGDLDTIWSIIDSDQYTYALFDNNLKKTADGNFIATGYKTDSIDKALIVKIDTLGNILLFHEYTYTNELLLQGQDIVELPGQGYLIVVDIVFTNYKADVLIIRTDTMGNVLNEQLYSKGNVEIPWVIRPMKNGDYMVGAVSGKNDNNTPYWAKTWLIEVDSRGNMVRDWLDTDSTNLSPNGMQHTADSGWIIVRQHLDYDVNDFQAFNASILKIDKNFNKQWDLHLGDSSDATGFNDIQILPSGQYIACGTTPTWGNDSAYYWGWLIKIDATGNIIWDRKYVADARFGAQSYLYDINILSNGDLLSCGELDFTYDVGINPIQQAWILRTDSNGCMMDQCWLSVQDISQPEVMINEYPNPTNDYINLSIGDITNARSPLFSLYNTLGQQVMSHTLTQDKASFPVSELAAGLFIFGVFKMKKE